MVVLRILAALRRVPDRGGRAWAGHPRRGTRSKQSGPWPDVSLGGSPAAASSCTGLASRCSWPTGVGREVTGRLLVSYGARTNEQLHESVPCSEMGPSGGECGGCGPRSCSPKSRFTTVQHVSNCDGPARSGGHAKRQRTVHAGVATKSQPGY